MKNSSLRGSLQLAMTILVVLIGFSVSQLVTRQYNIALLDNARAKAENIAHKLAVDSADLILINDLVTLQKEIDNQVIATPSVAYIFFERDSHVIAHTFKDGIPSALIGFNKPLDKTHSNTKKIQSENGERFLDIAWPIFDGHAGSVRLGISEAPYREKMQDLWIQVSLLAAFIIVLALGSIHILLVYLTRPLSNLANQVEKIDEENLEKPINVRGRREVTKLTTAFNRMRVRIGEYTQQLNQSNMALVNKNRALERAHKQLNTSFAISKGIAGLPKLHDICLFLLKTFRNILTCQQMVFLIFDPRKKLFMISDFDMKEYGQSEFDTIYSIVQNLNHFQYFQQEVLSCVTLPPNLKSSVRYAIFPIRQDSGLLGILVVGCKTNCSCEREELAVIDPILGQSVSAFNRALFFEDEIGKLNRTINEKKEFFGLIGKDPKMQTIFNLIETVATTEASVLIQGESGTGKELVAKAIHDMSHRKNKAFTIINCAAYPATLLESELFGHEKGAFTGAARLKAGRFEQADGGTVFLDEIGEISQSAQIKLLRVLQSRQFERLGGEKTLTVDIRILAATNKNLSNEVKAGMFREDLFYRLNVIPVNMPTLRERRNDIFLLAKFFLKRFATDMNKDITDITPEAMYVLKEYAWPGNVRELENTIEHATVLTKGHEIDVLDLPTLISDDSALHQGHAESTLSENEEQLVRNALEKFSWNKSKAAENLAISRGTLYKKIKKHNILPNRSLNN